MEISNVREIFRNILREVLFDNSCSCCRGKIEERIGFICSKCLNKFRSEAYLKNLHNFFYVFYYDAEIREVIADYKLRNRKKLGEDLAFLIKKPLENLIKNEKIDIILPVPISKERYKERGFNQVEHILDILKIKYKKIERIKNTKHMYGLENYDLRKKNVAGAFLNNLELSNKKILIVDDIVTSGATINSIIKEIEKNNENTEIKVFSIAISRSFIAK